MNAQSVAQSADDLRETADSKRWFGLAVIVAAPFTITYGMPVGNDRPTSTTLTRYPSGTTTSAGSTLGRAGTARSCGALDVARTTGSVIGPPFGREATGFPAHTGRHPPEPLTVGRVRGGWTVR